MTVEQSIKDIVAQKLDEGIVEKIIADNLEKGVKKAIEDIFGSWGDGTKAIKKKIESVMIPYLDGYDYSKYVVKLDHVLAEILKESTTANRLLLENFKEIMSAEDKRDSINVSEIYEKWMKYVEKNVNTDNLEVVYDDGVSYEMVDVRFEVVYAENTYSWESFKYANLILECEKDEDMNFAVRLSRWKDDRKEGFEIKYDTRHDLHSIKHLNSFELFLMKLDQNGTRVIIDEEYSNDEVTPEKEPEATFS
ncbi:hypothetical protein A9X05_09125 [Mycobacterium sp. E3298]|nr:hypothetical protein [Mycobacterium sp. E3298]OBG93855.1 hypothetical protein A9X05_09125 [Mycobacterium sp. E3298]